MSRRPPAWPVLAALLAAACGTAGPAPPAAPAASEAPRHLVAGFRYSTYGPEWNPGPAYWRDVGEQMVERFPGAVPGAVWIVGRLAGQGTELSFPGQSGDPLVRFTAADENEETLTLFDQGGFECWLQVEPGNAAVEPLIHLVLDRYGHHPCVVGVGVDVEWYRSVDEPDGEAVGDEEAAAWLAAARSHRPEYRLFLKHWLIEKLPPTVRDGILFIDDSQIFPSLDAMVAEFVEWGEAFAPAPVGFQVGYETDRPWWRELADPPAEIGRRILDVVPNTEGLYWVDFTVLEVFPPPPGHEPPRAAVAPDEPLVGVKIYRLPADLDELFAQWRELGVTTAFASEAVAGDAELRRRAAAAGVDVFVIAPVFHNPEALAENPGLYAVTARGDPARDDWVEFVCPSRPAYRERRVAEIAELVRRLRPQGLSLDFLRHFVFWERVEIATAHGDIPNTCFCPHCVAAFGERAGIEIPPGLDGTAAVAAWILDHHPGPWADWKVHLIDSMATEIVAAARAVDPDLAISLHAVPWRPFDYGGAMVRNVGQDLGTLSRHADLLSPMCYAHMLGRPPDWIHSVVLRQAEASAAPVLPSIQVQEAYRPGVPYTAAEFAEGLRAALEPPSRGVVFWSWEGLVAEPEKRRVAGEVLAELRRLRAEGSP
jgi:hypothetical protein